ncbi:MAG: translation initiation factor IF-2, partial [Hellea sp.]|nr:translation initiation factor IF-2 [Hellea sp.]
MTDTNDKKQIARKPLSLSSSGRGSVRQSFAGGRSKAVVVEKKKKVIIRPGSNTEVVKPKVAPKISIPPVKPKVDEVALAAKKLGLSKGEYEKRQSALSTAKAEADVRDAKKNTEQAEREQRMATENAALQARKKAEEEAELKRLEAEEENRQREEAAKLAARKPVGAAAALKKDDDNLSEIEKAGGRVKKKRAAPPPTRSKGETKRRRGKLTIVSALAGDDERQRSLASVKRAREREKQRQRGGLGDRDKVQREVIIPEAITVSELSNRMAERARDVVKYLMQQGTMATMNDILDADTAQLVVEDFGHTVKRVAEADVEDNFIIDDTPSDENDRKPR